MRAFPSNRSLTAELRAFVSRPRFDPTAAPARDDAWPRITIVTPSYNQARFLERTLLSIHNQGYPNLEHIVIDGGSDDGSVEILERYSARFAHWQSAPDDGQSAAINEGAKRATGAWMTWINSDDVLLPGALHALAAPIRARPSLELVYGNQVEMDEEDRVFKKVYTIDFDMDDFLLEPNTIVLQQSALWRVDLFTELGGLRLLKTAMDYDLVYRMFRRGVEWARIPQLLSGFRGYPESLTGSGVVAAGKFAEIDPLFLDYYGRARGPIDRGPRRAVQKGLRFAREPRALLGALEHRLDELLG